MGGLRRALVGAIRYFVLHPGVFIGWVAGVIVVVALVGGAVMMLPVVAPSIPGMATLSTQSAPLSTEDYLRGNKDYNADLVWRSLNLDAQSRLKDQGGSPEDLQRQMDSAKQHGIRLEEVAYIGGKSLPDGSSMQFYLVGIRQQPRPDIDYQPYMFTLDRDGKIAKVQ